MEASAVATDIPGDLWDVLVLEWGSDSWDLSAAVLRPDSWEWPTADGAQCRAFLMGAGYLMYPDPSAPWRVVWMFHAVPCADAPEVIAA